MIAAGKFDRAGFYDQTPVESRINNTQNLNFIRYLQHSRVYINSTVTVILRTCHSPTRKPEKTNYWKNRDRVTPTYAMASPLEL